MARRGIVALSLAALLGCGDSSGEDARPPDASAPVDATDAFDDGGPGAPDDGGPAPVECLEVVSRSEGMVELSPRGRDGGYALWHSTLHHGDRALVILESGPGGNTRCLAALNAALTVEWSRLLRFTLAEQQHLVDLAGTPHLFHVEPYLLRFAPIDAETGELGPEREADGLADPFEWTRIAGAPDGGFLTVWNEGWTMDARGYEADGTARADVVRLEDSGRYPSVTADGDRFIVGFHQLVDYAIAGPTVLALDASGAALSPTVRPDGLAPGGSDFVVERVDESLVAAWATSSRIRFARLSEELRPTLGPLTVHDTGTLDGARVTSMASLGSATFLTFYDLRLRSGGHIRVPSSAPEEAVVTTTDPWPVSTVVRAGEVVLGLRGGDMLRARVLE